MVRRMAAPQEDFNFSKAVVVEGAHVTHFRVVLALNSDGLRCSEGSKPDELVVRGPQNLTTEEIENKVRGIAGPILARLRSTNS